MTSSGASVPRARLRDSGGSDGGGRADRDPPRRAPAVRGTREGTGRPALVVSAVAGVGTLGLVWARRFEAARYGAVVAVAAVVAGWALAQNPVFLPGLTVEQAAASHDTLVAVIVAVVAGGAILLPLARSALSAALARPARPPERRARRRGFARQPVQSASRVDGPAGGSAPDRRLRIPERRRGRLGSRDRCGVPPGLRRYGLRALRLRSRVRAETTRRRAA